MLTVRSLWGFQQKIFPQTFMSLHWTPANAVKVHIAVTEPRLILYSLVIAFYCCSGDLQCVCLFRDTKSRTAEMEHNPGALNVNFICFLGGVFVSLIASEKTTTFKHPNPKLASFSQPVCTDSSGSQRWGQIQEFSFRKGENEQRKGV